MFEKNNKLVNHPRSTAPVPRQKRSEHKTSRNRQEQIAAFVKRNESRLLRRHFVYAQGHCSHASTSAAALSFRPSMARTSAKPEGNARHRDDRLALCGNGFPENGFHCRAGLQRLADRLK
jgi:hypothetical protein